MIPRRDGRTNRASLFDGASSSHSTLEISEQENDQALESLQDRVGLLKKLTTDINSEVQSQNRILDRMGNDMDSSRGLLGGTVDRFKRVLETKSGRNTMTLVAAFVVLFLLVYFLVTK